MMTPRVETCCNFKPTIKVVLTEIYMLFIIDLISNLYSGGDVVTGDPGSKPDQNYAWRRNMQSNV